MIELSRNQIWRFAAIAALLFLLVYRLIYLAGGEKVQGEVIAVYHPGRGGYYSWASNTATVQFSSSEGPVTFAGNTADDTQIGDKVQVIYKRDDPQKAYLDNFTGFWFMPLVCALLPLMIIIAATMPNMKSGDRLVIAFKGRPGVRLRKKGKGVSDPADLH